MQFTVGLAAALVAFPVAAQRVDTVVKTVDAPLHVGVATLVAERRIGAADGPDEYLFGGIGFIAVDKAGAIYAYDGQAVAVRKYDANGTFVKQFGRKGEGPGEYNHVSGVAVLPDGRVALVDDGNSRINFYSADGQPRGQILRGAVPVTGYDPKGLVADTASHLWFRAWLRVPRDAPAPIVWIRATAAGRIIDTLVVPTGATHNLTAGRSSIGFVHPVPFTPATFAAPSPLGYLVSGVSSRYAFEIVTPGGRSVTSLRRNVPPIPVSARERDSVRARVTAEMRGFNPDWTWNGSAIPSVRPAFDRLEVGDDGRVWVRLPFIPKPGVAESDQLQVWDVFEPSGTYVGQVGVPTRVNLHVRRGDYVWSAEVDADGVPRVVRYRIVWK